ncbi:MAG: type I methionyl aminopeptidase [Actinobacteria bacterium]|nr:MAG: type I methionyl aminopeptidase [Actinomycetota bacterium]
MIIRKSQGELVTMREAGRIIAGVLHEVKTFSKAGKTTKQLDDLARKLIKKEKAEPAFLGYKGYPASICTSINEQVVHGIPGEVVLKDGELLSVDIGVKYKGYFADAAVTVPIGEVSENAKALVEVAKKALDDAKDKAVVGNHLYDISAAIQKRAEDNGFSVVRDFVGHGIGQKMHEDPQIPNFGERGTGPILKEGMVLAIEPMVNQGKSEVKVLEDKWTVVTADKKLSAHFEHTIAVTSDGPQILTKL